MMKRTILVLCLLLCLCFGALAEAPAVPAVTPNPTPQPIAQYSISTLLSRGLDLLSRMDPMETVYTLQAYTPFAGANLALQPAGEEHLQAVLTVDAGSEPLELVVELAPDAAYVRWQGEAVGVRYEDLLDVFAQPASSALSDLEVDEEDATALEVMLGDLGALLADGTAHIAVTDSAIHLTTSFSQLSHALSRCADRIAQEEALIARLLEQIVYPLLPQEYAELKDVISTDTLWALLADIRDANLYITSDVVFSLTLHYDDSQENDRYTGTARLSAPMFDILEVTFSLEETGKYGDSYIVDAQLTYADMDSVDVTVDVQGVITDEYTSLRFIPVGFEQHTVALDIAYDGGFSLMLNSSVGTLQLSATDDLAPRATRYVLYANAGRFALDGELMLSRWYPSGGSAYLGVRYPGADRYSMEYNYFTRNTDGSIALRVGDSLVTAETLRNTADGGMRNTVAIAVDPDVSVAGDTLRGELVTLLEPDAKKIRLSQTLSTSADITCGWTLEAAPCEQAAQPIADAIMLTADDLRALPDVLSSMLEEDAAQ